MAASSEMKMIFLGKKSLEHPLHEHGLTLRELSKDCQVQCHFCRDRVHGRAYCCEDCSLILHEVCAQIEFPPVIQGHPSHCLDHPLKLVSEKRSYCCSDCGFSLGALTAVTTRLPPQVVEEATLRHFRHEEHLLSSFHVETTLEVHCGFCRQQICAGQAYGCRSCLFLLHEACARLTLEVQHPLHRQHPLSLLPVPTPGVECFVCSRSTKAGPAYCCGECRFTLHVGCTALTMDVRGDRKMNKEEEKEENTSSSIEPFWAHKHPLSPVHVGELVQSRVFCSMCELYISRDDAFACSDCRFFLHKSCAVDLPREIQHFLHPEHPRLVLQLHDPNDRETKIICGSCDNFCYTSFRCQDCDFALDPSCALQTLSAVEDGAAPYIPHFADEHPLRLAFINSRTVESCLACRKSITGEVAYHCTACGYCRLHRSCAELPGKLENAFHPQHTLVLSRSPAPYFFCNACHEKKEGLAFYCVECEFYMDVGCGSLNDTLKDPRHEHFLAYCKWNTTAQLLQCSCCGKRCKYDFYCCMPCNFSLHRDCLHLPPTVWHKSHHWHPLQLTDKFVDGIPNEQYCDYCETIRNPDHGVYRCEECSFSAHIECIISDYKEGTGGSETWGSDKQNQLNIEIASREVKMEIMERDLKAMEANLEILVAELAETIS